MARAILRDDFIQYTPPNPGLALDEDFGSSVPAALTPTDGGPIPGTPRPLPGTDIYPLLTVRERFSTGRNDDGDLVYSWAEVIKDASMIYSETRREVNDKSGLTEVEATMSILYSPSAPAMTASVTLRTSDGKAWTVSNVERPAGRLIFTAHRTENA